MNLQTIGAQSDHDEWDADKERMHGPSGNLVTISDGAGREVEMTQDEREDFERDMAILIESDEITPGRFESLLVWLRENELLVEVAPKPATAPAATQGGHWSGPGGCHEDCPACAGERKEKGQGGHTPGPWAVKESRHRDCSDSIRATGDDIVAFVESNDVGAATAKANARLIAAAPELLEALLHAKDLLRAYGMETPALIGSVIAKARGGAQ